MPELVASKEDRVNFHAVLVLKPGENQIVLNLPEIPEGKVFNGTIEVRGDITEPHEE